MKKIILLSLLTVMFISCESGRVKKNRETYKQFLYGMSDSKEFLIINSEKITITGEEESTMSFFVDFETKYCGKTLKDKVEFKFIGDNLFRINDEFYDKYNANYLIKVIRE